MELLVIGALPVVQVEHGHAEYTDTMASANREFSVHCDIKSVIGGQTGAVLDPDDDSAYCAASLALDRLETNRFRVGLAGRTDPGLRELLTAHRKHIHQFQPFPAVGLGRQERVRLRAPGKTPRLDSRCSSPNRCGGPSLASLSHLVSSRWGAVWLTR
jgi:hypothetical protein